MAKFILNLFGALLFAAALAAAATPALAQDIQPIQANTTCQQKLPDDSFFICGSMPIDGTIAFTNTGVHKVTLFTTEATGATCEPGSENIVTEDPEQLKEFCGAVQVNAGLAVDDSAQIPAEWASAGLHRSGRWGVVIEPHHDHKIHCVASVRRRERSEPVRRRPDVRRVQRDYA